MEEHLIQMETANSTAEVISGNFSENYLGSGQNGIFAEENYFSGDGFNISGNWSELDDYMYFSNETMFTFSPFFQVSVHLAYNLILIFGLLGNVLVCYVILFSPTMRTVTNCFLFNLALGDLLIGTLCLPFGYLELLLQYWPFGEVVCIVHAPAKAVGVFVSSYTLIALTLDRYKTILNPLKPRLRRRHSLLIVAIIWIAAILTAVPIGLVVRVEVHDESGLPRCGEYGWATECDEIAYNAILLVLQYLVPVIVLAYCYSRISRVVWGERAVQQSLTKTPESSLTAGKRKTVVMSLVLTAGYTVAWLPYVTIYMVNQHWNPISNNDVFPYVFFFCHFLAMSHTVFNPVIYVWINSRFRSAFKEVLHTRCCTSTQRRRRQMWTTSWRQASSTKNTNTSDKNSLKKLVAGESLKNGNNNGNCNDSSLM